jgi:cytochrome c oxidase assembly protein subunit 11
MKSGEDLKNQKLIWKLGLVIVGMFGFGFLMVPIYDVFCDITGLNGKTGTVETVEARGFVVDYDRLVTVEFVASTNQGLNWEFKPQVVRMKVHPGELYDATYLVSNNTSRVVTGQAVPSVMPNVASRYFKKTECFCFVEQVLKPGETREMPLRFVIEPELPENVKTVSLGYTFFDVTNSAKNQAGKNHQGG